MKIHFMTSEGTHAIVQKYTFPQFYDIKNDPAEMYELWANEGYSHAWVMEPVSRIIGEVMGSMARYRNIKPGEEFEGYE